MKSHLRCFKAPIRDYIKLGRNDNCLCGSGIKYKKCCEPKGLVFKRKEKNESGT